MNLVINKHVEAFLCQNKFFIRENERYPIFNPGDVVAQNRKNFKSKKAFPMFNFVLTWSSMRERYNFLLKIMTEGL
jgi:hypothetical protein